MPTDDPHIVHLQGRVDRLESDVTEIKSGVKTLLDRPQNPGLQQVLGTLVSTLVACGMIFAFAEWRILQAVTPLETYAKSLEIEQGHQNERIWLNRISTAVHEERERWLESRLTVIPKSSP